MYRKANVEWGKTLRGGYKMVAKSTRKAAIRSQKGADQRLPIKGKTHPHVGKLFSRGGMQEKAVQNKKGDRKGKSSYNKKKIPLVNRE